MKTCVEYYDIETDSSVNKKCFYFFYDAENPMTFEFNPVDEPVTIYKSIVINHPIIAIHHNEYRTKIHVTGYQALKDGKMGRTNTIITISAD